MTKIFKNFGKDLSKSATDIKTGKNTIKYLGTDEKLPCIDVNRKPKIV